MNGCFSFGCAYFSDLPFLRRSDSAAHVGFWEFPLQSVVSEFSRLPGETQQLIENPLNLARDVSFGFHKEIARDADDALIGATTGRLRQFWSC